MTICKNDKLSGNFICELHQLITKYELLGLPYRDIISDLETSKFTKIYLQLTKKE